MSEQIAQTFVEALRTLETAKDVEPLVALYAEEAAIGNVIAPDLFHGPEGARQFWTEYRGTFDKVESQFRNMIATEGRAALEWATQGSSFEGSPLQYTGVTILEITSGKITRSSAYFDPGALGRQIEN